MLSLIMLINRSGSVVLPFLSVYLADDLGFSLEQIGIILSTYGLGSLTGSWLGGLLTDKLGNFKVQLGSLFFSAIGFFMLKHIESFQGLALGFFLVTIITDSLRPANATAISNYSKPENLTKAYSLNRMAVNLGFAVGPGLGGMLASKGFELLFIADGITCFLAAILFGTYFMQRKRRNIDQVFENVVDSKKPLDPFKDRLFLFFCLCTFGFAVVFFQLLNTLPLYYSEIYKLSETYIGFLLALNGLIVFGLEMPLVDNLSKRNRLRMIASVGTLLAGVAYIILNFSDGFIILLLSMTILSISEILVMPFLTTYTVNRAGKKSKGKYLGLYGMSYSLALIVAPALGTFLIDYFGYRFLWVSMFCLASVAGFGFYNVIPQKNIDVFEPDNG